MKPPKASDAIYAMEKLLDLSKQGRGRGLDAPILAAVASATLDNEVLLLT